MNRHADGQPDKTNNDKPKTEISHPIRSTSKRYHALQGVPRIKTKRIVLYNVSAEESFDSVKDMIYDYAKDQRVRVTFVRLMKRNERQNYQDTYTVQVNLDYDDYEQYISG